MIAVKILIVSGLLIMGPELCQQTKPHDSPPPKRPSPDRHHISTEHGPRHPPPQSPANHRIEHLVASSHKDHPSHSGPLSPSPIGGRANHRPPPKKYVQKQPAPDHHNRQKVHMDEQSPVKDPGSKPPFTPRPMDDNTLSPKKSIPGSPLKSKADALSMDSNIRPAESSDPAPVKPANTKRKGLARPALAGLTPLQVYKYTEKKWTLAECLIHCENTVGYVAREKQPPIFISKGAVDSYQRCKCGLNKELIDFLKTNERNSTAFEEAFSKNPSAARYWLTLQKFRVLFPITEYNKWDPKKQEQVPIVDEKKKNDAVTPKKNEKGTQEQNNPNLPKEKDAVTPKKDEKGMHK
ncbi:unnamed protein product [Bemisia tabaci]|uniref:Uncharacterized protein n=1 Tax=Bemisia tabaci TaxID=7038 RepID=A0A9P0A3N4_BEMTA|nr:unnamed protein product [Bemisia tabaci]